MILPAGDVQLGRFDYNIYTNSMLGGAADINRTPLKMVGQSPVRVSDIGEAKDSQTLQYNVVRVNGQRSVYLPILKQGGDSNTIAVVDGVREKARKLVDTPDSLRTSVVFDQSEFVKSAIQTLLHEGALGLLLTSLMILVFLGSMRATVAVFFSIPLSALATFMALQFGGSSINTMVLGGLALALSRLIDNSVVVLENIYRHLEMGEPPAVAAEQGGREVALAGAGGHPDHGRGLLSRDAAVRRQQIPVLFAGAGRGALAACFVRGGADGGAAVLRAFPEAASHGLMPLRRMGRERSTTWFNRGFERFLDVYRPLRDPRRGASRSRPSGSSRASSPPAC